MRTMIKKLVPAPLRPALGSAWWKLQHRYITVKLFGRDAGFVPPLSLMYDGPAGYQEFKENGAEFLKYYVEVCNLRPDEAVLDIGSGTGRKTLPLLGYLSERGSYLGMEIVKSGVIAFFLCEAVKVLALSQAEAPKAVYSFTQIERFNLPRLAFRKVYVALA